MRRRVPRTPFDFKHLSNLDNFCAVQSGKGTSATGHLELSSDEAAHRAIMPSVVHDTERYANNRLKSRMSRSDGASDKCEGSNPWLTRNDSGRCTESSKIFSESDVTCCGQSTTASYDLAPSLFGKR